MALTAQEKTKFAEQEQEVILLRGALDKTKTELERVSAEGLAKIKSLEQDNTSLVAQLVDAAARIELASADVLELNGELVKAHGRRATPPADSTLEHDGKHYRLTAGKFNLDGTEYARQDVTEGSDVLARLVEMGAGILEEAAPAE